mmetsp:Transcript_4943/g.11234  ORF Transcript_4943/g.11234 Transcript_4943/m.11234 type:complete len:222 (-) Transcript_4943:828-1493(-)
MRLVTASLISANVRPAAAPQHRTMRSAACLSAQSTLALRTTRADGGSSLAAAPPWHAATSSACSKKLGATHPSMTARAANRLSCSTASGESMTSSDICSSRLRIPRVQACSDSTGVWFDGGTSTARASSRLAISLSRSRRSIASAMRRRQKSAPCLRAGSMSEKPSRHAAASPERKYSRMRSAMFVRSSDSLVMTVLPLLTSSLLVDVYTTFLSSSTSLSS